MSMSGMPSQGIEYLRAEDLAISNVFKEFELTVKDVIAPGQSKSADGKPIDKPVLTFTNAKKRMILGKMNRRLMAYATGSNEPSEWPGAKIRLRVCILEKCLGQTNVATLRIVLVDSANKPFIAKKDYGTPATGKPMSNEQAAIKAEVAKADAALSAAAASKPTPPTTEIEPK